MLSVPQTVLQILNAQLFESQNRGCICTAPQSQLTATTTTTIQSSRHHSLLPAYQPVWWGMIWKWVLDDFYAAELVQRFARLCGLSFIRDQRCRPVIEDLVWLPMRYREVVREGTENFIQRFSIRKWEVFSKNLSLALFLLVLVFQILFFFYKCGSYLLCSKWPQLFSGMFLFCAKSIFHDAFKLAVKIIYAQF